MCVLILKTSHRPDGKNADALASTLALHNWECIGQLRVQFVRATVTCKSSHRPGGKNADALALISRLHNCERRFGQLQDVRAAQTSKVPIAPMGFSHVLRVCSQGGGVAVWGGTVTFSSCTITGNTAAYVRAQKFPSPRWENY